MLQEIGLRQITPGRRQFVAKGERLALQVLRAVQGGIAMYTDDAHEDFLPTFRFNGENGDARVLLLGVHIRDRSELGKIDATVYHICNAFLIRFCDLHLDPYRLAQLLTHAGFKRIEDWTVHFDHGRRFGSGIYPEAQRHLGVYRECTESEAQRQDERAYLAT